MSNAPDHSSAINPESRRWAREHKFQFLGNFLRDFDPAECHDAIDTLSTEAGMSVAEMRAAVELAQQSPPPPAMVNVVDALAASRARELARGSVVRKKPKPEERDAALPVLDDSALYGVLGDAVRLADPLTEADPAGLLVALATMAGCALDSDARVATGNNLEKLNLFSVLVGRTFTGRKSTAVTIAHQFFYCAEDADQTWATKSWETGLTSGEGIISRFKPVEEGAPVTPALFVEEEYGGVIERIGRDGNTLSATMCQMRDDKPLGTVRSGDLGRVSKHHGSVLGCITPTELKPLMEGKGGRLQHNGWGNRHLWVFVERRKRVKGARPLPRGIVAPLQARLWRAIRAAHGVGVLGETQAGLAAKAWVEDMIDAWHEGEAPLMLERALSNVMRVAGIHALLDERKEIDHHHVMAAWALLDYCRASAGHIWGRKTDTPGRNELERRIVQLLTDHALQKPEGLTTTFISTELFGKHPPQGEPTSTLLDMEKRELLASTLVPTMGRAAKRWRATGIGEEEKTAKLWLDQEVEKGLIPQLPPGLSPQTQPVELSTNTLLPLNPGSGEAA